MLDAAQARCRQLLDQRRAQLDGLGTGLLDHEVLSAEPLMRCLTGAVAQPMASEAEVA